MQTTLEKELHECAKHVIGGLFKEYSSVLKRYGDYGNVGKNRVAYVSFQGVQRKGSDSSEIFKKDDELIREIENSKDPLVTGYYSFQREKDGRWINFVFFKGDPEKSIMKWLKESGHVGNIKDFSKIHFISIFKTMGWFEKDGTLTYTKSIYKNY